MFISCQKITGFIIAVTFAAVTFFGINAGMNMGDNGTMSGCLFDQSVACTMNYEEHINHWQHTFIATQPTQRSLLAVIIFLTLCGATPFFFLFSDQLRNEKTAHLIPRSLQRLREIIAKLSDHILHALSNGILNSTLYNLIFVTR